MKGRMTKLAAGPNGVRAAGQIVDLEPDEAERYMADHAFEPFAEGDAGLEAEESASTDDDAGADEEKGDEGKPPPRTRKKKIAKKASS